jgi:hypothetical protein
MIHPTVLKVMENDPAYCIILSYGRGTVLCGSATMQQVQKCVEYTLNV